MPRRGSSGGQERGHGPPVSLAALRLQGETVMGGPNSGCCAQNPSPAGNLDLVTGPCCSPSEGVSPHWPFWPPSTHRSLKRSLALCPISGHESDPSRGNNVRLSQDGPQPPVVGAKAATSDQRAPTCPTLGTRQQGRLRPRGPGTRGSHTRNRTGTSCGRAQGRDRGHAPWRRTPSRG